MGIFLDYDSAQVGDFFKKYCPSKNLIYNCLDLQINNYNRECLDDDTLHGMQFGNSAIKSFLDYICRTNGDIIACE